MASIKKSVESLKGTSHSAAKGVTGTAGKSTGFNTRPSRENHPAMHSLNVFRNVFVIRQRVTVCFFLFFLNAFKIV